MPRPTKFNKEVQRQLLILAEKGWTDKEMAHLLGISDRTIDNWKRRYPMFFRSLKEAKAVADSQVERSLFERACGFTCLETKAKWINNEQGDRWETIELIKHYPPDTTACIFWLKNRQPDEWRDKHTVDLRRPEMPKLSEEEREILKRYATMAVKEMEGLKPRVTSSSDQRANQPKYQFR